MTEGDLYTRDLALRAALHEATVEALLLAKAARKLKQPELAESLVWLGETLESAAESMNWKAEPKPVR